MRTPLGFVIAIALGGCGTIQRVGTDVGMAVQTLTLGLVTAGAATVARPPTTVVVQPQVTIETPPAGSTQYSTWVPRQGRCNSGREFHLRCVRGPGGQDCFFESDDGESFDCVDPECAKVPDGVNAWCASTQDSSLARP
jgi:hypothetical protein